MSLFLGSPLVGHAAFGQSSVRPVPIAGKAPRGVYGPHAETPEALDVNVVSLAARLADEPGPPTEPQWNVEMALEGHALPAADLESGAGERSVVRGGWCAVLTREQAQHAFALLLDTEASFYDWNAAAPIAGGTDDPFNDLYRTHVGALASFDEDDAIGFFAGLEVGLVGEDNADVQDSITVGGLAGVRCRANDELTMSFGLAALTRLADDPWILPYVGFDWRMSERVRLATEGAKVLLEANLSSALETTLAVEYELRQYRLNDSNAIPEGVFQDDQIHATGELAWRASEHVELALAAGAVIWQESTFLEQHGTTLAEIETDPAAFAGVALRFNL